MLSFNNIGVPICRIGKGNLKNKIISVFDPYDSTIDEKKKRILIENGFNQFDLHNGSCMIPIPNPNERECIYICGPSGCGKSTWVATYMKEWKKIFPKDKIYIFSKVDYDPAFKDIDVKYIPITEEFLINDPIEISEFKNCLIIMDDIDTIEPPKVKNAIISMQSSILQTGRHHNIYLCSTRHLILGYRETRELLNESHKIVMYPHAGGGHLARRALEIYCGISKEEIKYLLSLKSRWICIKKTAPMAVLHMDGVKILGNEKKNDEIEIEEEI